MQRFRDNSAGRRARRSLIRVLPLVAVVLAAGCDGEAIGPPAPTGVYRLEQMGQQLLPSRDYYNGLDLGLMQVIFARPNPEDPTAASIDSVTYGAYLYDAVVSLKGDGTYTDTLYFSLVDPARPVVDGVMWYYAFTIASKGTVHQDGRRLTFNVAESYYSGIATTDDPVIGVAAPLGVLQSWFEGGLGVASDNYALFVDRLLTVIDSPASRQRLYFRPF